MRRCMLRFTGYKFFEDQFPRSAAPSDGYQTYEDQMAGAQITAELQPKPEASKEQKVKRLMKWEQDTQGCPSPSGDWGWKEQWGPAPADPGHNTWYDKSRIYMSYEEKQKYDIGHARPLKAGELRQNTVELNQRLGSGAISAVDKYGKQPDEKGTVHYNKEEQKDTFGTVRQEYVDEWLEQPGCTPNNIGNKIADFYGTTDKHSFHKAPRRPDWELPQAPEQ